MKIAFIGSGSVATALGGLLAAAGHQVTLGLRGPATRAAVLPSAPVADAVAGAEVVILALPFTAIAEALPPLAAALAGKIVVDATNALNPDYSPMDLGGQSSADQVQALIPGARLVKAFNTIFADVMRADRLNRGGQPMTALMAADDADALAMVADMARGAGFAPVTLSRLAAARHLDSVAHLNIALAFGEGGGTNAAFLYHRA